MGEGRTAAKCGGAFCDARPRGPRAARTLVHAFCRTVRARVRVPSDPHNVFTAVRFEGIGFTFPRSRFLLQSMP
eukprot:3152280-Prymnesium_polylepis.1